MTTPRWVYPNFIVKELGVCKDTARKIMRTIPGHHLLYRTETGRRRWRCSGADWDAWRASLVSCA